LDNHALRRVARAGLTEPPTVKGGTGLNSEHWQGRVKVEQILEVHCPKCGARPHQWCDRAGDRLSKRGKALAGAGTPPSHTERMWKRQGHEEHEFPALRAKQKPGQWDEPAPGKRAARDPAPRGGCGPCAAERKIREKLNSPGFPADFPCRHPRPGEIVMPGYPRRYTLNVACPGCKGAACG
jgi:hypothetical protein